MAQNELFYLLPVALVLSNFLGDPKNLGAPIYIGLQDWYKLTNTHLKDY